MNRFLTQKAIELQQGGIRAFFDKAASYQNVINLGIGEPDSHTPQPIVKAANKAAQMGKTHYTPNAGEIETRRAVAGYLERFGYHADPVSEIIITSGGMGAVSTALLCAVSPGDEIIIQDPQWLNYISQVSFMGGVPVRVPVYEENAFQLDPDDVKKHITPKTRLIMLNSPNNPTGAVMSSEVQKRIAQIATSHNLLVISDEVYSELLYDGRRHHSIAALEGMHERTIVVNSLSKTFAMTGWRIGYAAGPAHFIQKMVCLQENLSACASSVGQSAAVYALSTRCGVEEMRSEYELRRNLLVKGLNEIDVVSCPMPQGTFYAFANIKQTGLTSIAVANRLLEKANIVTIPGSAFGPHGEGYLRISFVRPQQMLHEALSRMKECFERKV